MNVDLPDEAATIGLAQHIRAGLRDDIAGVTILLEGELGAGKSTLARALIRALGHEGTVPSPTYTLIEPYRIPVGVIYHVDLYRITSEAELRFLGWAELEDGLRLVEWPERVPSLAGGADLRIRLTYAGEGRSAELFALRERGRQLLAGAAASMNSPEH